MSDINERGTGHDVAAKHRAGHGDPGDTRHADTATPDPERGEALIAPDGGIVATERPPDP